MTDEKLEASVTVLTDWIAKHAPKPWHRTPDGVTVTESGTTVIDELVAIDNVLLALRIERAAHQATQEDLERYKAFAATVKSEVMHLGYVEKSWTSSSHTGRPHAGQGEVV